MRILFPADPLAPREVDPAFAVEADAAGGAGCEVEIVDLEALLDERDPRRAVRRVSARPGSAVYRGWMLRPGAYSLLHEALGERGVGMVTSPVEYRTCHHLPEVYPFLEGRTPRTVWVPVDEPWAAESVARLAATLGPGPLVVKDYVKSRKHEWLDACFIPSGTDGDAVARVTGNFRDRQGEVFEGGLVLREYVPLRPAGTHPRSGMPLSREARCFVVAGKVVTAAPYWEDVDQEPVDVPGWVHALVREIPSPFFTLDLAQRASDGEWIVMEAGDGQVSEMLGGTDPAVIFRALRENYDR